jgi:hypothetical protein
MDFARLLEIVLPKGGYVLASMEAYFDESGTTNEPVLCVAGYVLDSSNARRLDRQWRAVLAEYGLSYFHMVDCAHGNREFAKLEREDRIAIEKRMIAIIHANAAMGVGATVNVGEYDELMLKHPQIGSAYSFCARHCLTATRAYVEEDLKASGDIAYFFEAGHRSQSEANRIMNDIFADASRCREYRYAGHGFYLKESIPALQAADLLAWQLFTHRKRQLAGGSGFRKDFEALLQGTLHKIVHMAKERLTAVNDEIVRGALAEMAEG